MWFNETGGSDSIQVNFCVVPLPSTLNTVLSAGALLAGVRLRRRARAMR
jgi:hypothetical protein